MLIICGTGIATSTVVAVKIRDYLAAQADAPAVDIQQGKVMDVLGGTDADLVVATTQMPSTVKARVINAVPLLTGIGADAILRQVKEALTQ